jgi:drug/metabolite transporter (DMT)-like permease
MYLFLSIVFNGLLLVIFKYFSKWNIDLLTAIVVNYFTAFIVGLLVDGGEILSTNPFTAPWFGPLIIMGLCFILGFNFIALTVRYAGITITTIMQKITFLTVVFYALIVFNESANWVKITGVACATVAVILVSAPNRGREGGKAIKSWILLLPILTFLVSSVIDVPGQVERTLSRNDHLYQPEN